MREEILHKAGEMFLNLGFKSVTMDDIAAELGVSKKTIYKYFENKLKLVEDSTVALHESCLTMINMIIDQGHNPIKENFEIKKMFKEMFQNASSSPIYQLKKYYPAIYEKVMKKEMVAFSDCLKSNLERGIEEGYYRTAIDIELYIQFYFSLVFSIHESVIENYKIPDLEKAALEYHTRAIATEKGIEELEKHL
ncbi:MAG: TetR family transcriptional regulator [Flavobacteriaceae bacterium]|nr:MAG: TetR family transcriptional regulator [Flavobacteriaceae bacterium]